VLRSGGETYLYGSTDPDIWRADGVGFDVYVSERGLETWRGPYPAFRPPEGFWSKRNFWAPEVYEYGGSDGAENDKSFYMFATFLPENGSRGTAILRADSPMGPFLPHSNGIVTPPSWECLDGTFWVDNNTPYMVFCHEWTQVGDGQICAVELSRDLKRAVAEPRVLFTASSAPWAFPLAGRKPGSFVTDGPFMYRASGGELLILWSSFNAQGSYCIGVATSSDGTLGGEFRQSEQALFEADGGHGMVFEYDGKLYLAIHSPNRTPDERAIFVPLIEQNGALRLKNNAE
jgi:hypothetical protein